MSFFRKKINPFCSLTINLGPLYVERVFDSLLTLQGVKETVRMAAAERFERYLDFLREKVNRADHAQYRYIQFYRAHFCQQLAHCSGHSETARHWQEKALCYYQIYLELAVGFDESSYYAQWQSGILQNILHYTWPQVEESLLKALAFDNLRGEPLKMIIDHYIRTRQWRIAYSFSQRALKDYFERNPTVLRSWFIDLDAYNWNVINKHLTICYKLGYLSEAERSYEQMLQYELRHPDEFKPSEIRHIHSLQKIFHANKPTLATAS